MADLGSFLASLRRSTVALVALVVVPAFGQAPIEPSAPPAPAPPPIRLSPDPEAPPTVEGWWSNGQQLLELADDGAYRIYGDQNRHKKPLEVGRWWRQHYAALWLQPYTMRKETRTRVGITMAEDGVALQVREWKPLRKLSGPPATAEDLFIGLWVGPGGSLDLGPSLRYHYVAPRSASEGRAVTISSHRGTWEVHEGQVVLNPDSPAVTRLRFDPEATSADESFRILRGVEGPLERVAPKPKKP